MNRDRDDPTEWFQGGSQPGVAEGSPRTIGNYEVVDELGRGCMGVVYRVIRPSDGCEFALKVVLDTSPSEEAIGRFAREAQVGIRLRHPGIVPVVDLGQAGGRMFLVMEYCPGPTLKDTLRERGRMPAAEAAELAATLADALAAAHQQGVLHRDLKPSNVIMDARNGAPRITDFGLARDQRDTRELTVSGQAVGTPSHMAPEQIQGKQIDARAEVWSLGVLLYECISGELPFPAETYTEVGHQILKDDPPSPGGDLPALAAFTLSMLAKNREHRPATMHVVAAKLRELATPQATVPSTGGAALTVPLVAGVATTTAVLALGGLLLWLLLWDPGPGAGPPPPPPGGAQVGAMVSPETPAASDPARGTELLKQAEELAASLAIADQVLPLYAEALPYVQDKPGQLARLQRGRLFLLFRRGLYEEAIREADALIESDDLGLVYHAMRVKGWALIRLDQAPAGLATWRKLADLDPQGHEGAAAGSRIAFFSNNAPEGMRLNKLALERQNPADPQSYLTVSAAYGALQAGDSERALRLLKEAEALSPDEPRVHLIRAFVFQGLKRWRRARESVEQALELTAPRGFAQALDCLAKTALQQQDAAGALEAYSRLVDDFNNGAALFQRARILWQTQRRAEAKADLVRLRNGFPQIWARVYRMNNVKPWLEEVLSAK